MNTLQSVREWWRARDDRERWMLTAMFAMLAAFVYWYGLLAPLRHLRDSARAGYDRAAADVVAVRALAAELHDIETRHGGRGPDRAALLKSAADAGIAISRQRRDASGTLSLGIDGAHAGPLFAWLAQLRHAHGIGPRTLRVDKHDGALRVELTLATGADRPGTSADADGAGDRSGTR